MKIPGSIMAWCKGEALILLPPAFNL